MDNKITDSIVGIMSSIGVYLGKEKQALPRLELWGIWPLQCGCRLYLGRIAWVLDDNEITQWVANNVQGHICESEKSTIKGAVTQVIVNGKPTHNMIWVTETEFDRVRRLIA